MIDVPTGSRVPITQNKCTYVRLSNAQLTPCASAAAQMHRYEHPPGSLACLHFQSAKTTSIHTRTISATRSKTNLHLRNAPWG